MSKDIEHILREIAKTNKDVHAIDNHMSKGIADVKRAIENIDKKIKLLESKLDQAMDILNTFTILISDQDDLDDDSEMDYESENNWNPYDNPESYDEVYDDDEEKEDD